jgi:integral membrane protein (TIGR01906 family)
VQRYRLAQLTIAACIPVLLGLGNARLAMSPRFVEWQYSRPGYPIPARLTEQQRSALVESSIAFVRGEASAAELGALTINGRPAFRAAEISHLRDVQVVLAIATRAALGAGLMIVVTSIGLLARRQGRALARAMLWGGAATLGLLAVMGALATISWQSAFVGFHEVLFAPGTWAFPESDTLIQLYPEPLWRAAVMWLLAAVSVQAAVIGGVGWVIVRST